MLYLGGCGHDRHGYSFRKVREVAVCAECHCINWSLARNVMIPSHYTGTRRTPLGPHPRACQVHSRMSGYPVIVRAGAYLLYLADDCYLVSDSTRHSLRLADVLTCVLPWTFSSYGNRLFLLLLYLVCGNLYFLKSRDTTIISLPAW